MAGSERDEPQGWEPHDQDDIQTPGEGRGAATGGEPDGIPGTGDYGDDRGPGDGEEGGELLPNGDRASTRR